MSYEIPLIGKGELMKELSEDDQIRDDVGFTNPNLHRRVDPTEQDEGEFDVRDYELRILGLYSQRTTSYHYYDDNDPDEKP